MADVIPLPTRRAPDRDAFVAMVSAQTGLAIALASIVRSGTAYVHTDSEVDRNMALIGVEEAALAIQQIAALLAPRAPQPEPKDVA